MADERSARSRSEPAGATRPARLPPEAESGFPVGEAARRVGIPVATLRSWNTRYRLGPAGHRTGRHRTYSAADIDALRSMVDLVRSGVSPAAAAAAIFQTIAPAGVDSLIDAAFALDTGAAVAQLAGHLRARGVVATWEDLCRPALQCVNDQQNAGRSCIDVEHFLSWCITATLHQINTTVTARAGIVLACTPGERHLLPLEAVRATLAEHDVATEMLGADVPIDALTDAVGHHYEPVTVLLWSQHESTGSAAAVRACVRAHAAVLAAGPGWADVRLPSGTPTVTSLAEVEQCLVPKPDRRRIVHR